MILLEIKVTTMVEFANFPIEYPAKGVFPNTASQDCSMEEPPNNEDEHWASIDDLYVKEPEVILVPDTSPSAARPGPPKLDITMDHPGSISHTVDTISSFTSSRGTLHKDGLEKAAKKMLCKILCNPRADWTCKEQKEATLTLLELKEDALIAMRTGSGKTMAPIIASQLESDKVSVIVLPLKSLMNDYMRRLRDMRIGFEIFLGGKTRHLTGTHNLILVSADMTKTSHWRQCLGELNERKSVVRAVFDEGQFAFTGNNYRPALQNLYDLRLFPMQLIVMSGTVPPRCEQTLFESFGLMQTAKVIRTSSDRRELEYILEPPLASNREILERVKEIVKEHLLTLDTEGRILVFVPYLEEGKKISKALNCQFYSGDSNTGDEDRLSMHKSWVEGDERVMVCTAAFGAGNDHPHVRVVTHAGTPLGGWVDYRYLNKQLDFLCMSNHFH
jgi:hypothetical protein